MKVRLLAAALPLISVAAIAAPVEDVPSKWRTPYDLYLTPREAWQMKQSCG